MTAHVTSRCASCGTVSVDLAAVRLLFARPDLDGDLRNTLCFRCPACDVERAERMSSQATRLLMSAGVTLLAGEVVPARDDDRADPAEDASVSPG